MRKKVNNKRDRCIFDIEAVEKKYGATYVGELCIKLKTGEWTNFAVSVFYQKTPAKPEYSNYFGLYTKGGNAYITDAISAVDTSFLGVVADDGEVIYSAYRHDYTTSKDGSVFIDGGREYIRRSGG